MRHAKNNNNICHFDNYIYYAKTRYGTLGTVETIQSEYFIINDTNLKKKLNMSAL